MCVFIGNLSSKTLKCHISSMTHDLKFLLLWERVSIRWLLMRVLQKQLQVFTKVIQIRPFLIFLTIIPANFFWIKCVIFSPCHDRDFRKRPCDFRTLPKMSADVPKTFEHFRSYLKDDSFSVFWFRKNTIRRQNHHLTPFRTEFSLFIMC